MEEPSMSNPTDPVREDAVFDVLVLAAIERGARHRARDHEGVPVWAIRAHLHIPARSRDARRLRVRLRVLESEGLLSTGGRGGVVLWSLTETGQGRLRADQATGGVPELPESPQHIAWRQACAAAQEHVVGFDQALGEAALGTFALLDAGRAGQPARSDEWFAMGERLQRSCRRMGSAIHCLHEWAEPSDDQSDIDDRREPGDDRLEPAERDRRRARRVGRRNIALWDTSSAPDAQIAQRGRLLIALGQTIRQLRVERDMSAEQLAGAAGLKQTRLEAIEAGRLDLRYEVLLALAGGLGVQSGELVTRAEAVARDRMLTVGGQVMRWTIHDDVVMIVLTPDKALDRKALQAVTMEVERIFDQHVSSGASASANFKAGCVEVDIVLDGITAAEIARKLDRLEQGT
jgi:ribosome-binding protein aMBF1 (putative translation factor)